MAKRSSKSESASPQSSKTAASYTVTAVVTDELSSLTLIVKGTDGREYRLQTHTDDRVDLVRQLLSRLAANWQDAGFRFKADAKGVITEVI